MKVFLCDKRQILTTFSWCARDVQLRENDFPFCHNCDHENIRQTKKLYTVDDLFGKEMMEEYNLIIKQNTMRAASTFNNKRSQP